LQFQMKWLKHCSSYLLKSNTELSRLGLLPQDPVAQKIAATRILLYQVWTKYKLSQCNIKSFMIIFCNCVFNKLLSLCHAVIEPESAVNGASADIEGDRDDVFYKFAGASIAKMLHNRYEKIQDSQQKGQISNEITLLQKLSVHDKDKKEHISDSLKYRDKVFPLLGVATIFESCGFTG